MTAFKQVSKNSLHIRLQAPLQTVAVVRQNRVLQWSNVLYNAQNNYLFSYIC